MIWPHCFINEANTTRKTLKHNKIHEESLQTFTSFFTCRYMCAFLHDSTVPSTTTVQHACLGMKLFASERIRYRCLMSSLFTQSDTSSSVPTQRALVQIKEPSPYVHESGPETTVDRMKKSCLRTLRSSQYMHSWNKRHVRLLNSGGEYWAGRHQHRCNWMRAAGN